MTNARKAELKKIMTAAWDIARNAARVFGGSSKSYFSEALKQAWGENKMNDNKMEKFTDTELANQATCKIHFDMDDEKAKAWESNDGKIIRIYINGFSQKDRKIDFGFFEVNNGIFLDKTVRGSSSSFLKECGFNVQ